MLRLFLNREAIDSRFTYIFELHYLRMSNFHRKVSLIHQQTAAQHAHGHLAFFPIATRKVNFHLYFGTRIVAW
jgi:hypothetical protein